jgi:phosphoglycerol transferase MdoB-like AlkP superfamily enzyme
MFLSEYCQIPETSSRPAIETGLEITRVMPTNPSKITPLKRAFLASCALTLSLLCLILLVHLMDPWLIDLGSLKLLVLNATPVLLLFLLLLGILGRLLPAFACCLLAAVALFYVNDIKLFELQQPLTSTDFLLWRQVIDGSALLSQYGDAQALLVVVVVTVALLIVSHPFEPLQLARRSRFFLALASSILLLSLSSSPVHRLYANTGALDTPWHPLASVKNSGLIASLVTGLESDFFDLPDPQPVQAEQLRQRIASLGPAAAGVTSPSPSGDLIIILSESFFDPGILQGVETCEVLPRWCDLTARGLTGTLQVPTFGGNTTRTEFEVLTGIPYRILPTGIYPYQSVVTRPTLSLAWLFRHQGYRTLAIHPHLGSFWQRDRAMPLLGFEDFLSERDMPNHERAGYYISDRTMTDQIIEALPGPDDPLLFLFAISMENHGPWASYRPNMDQARLASMPVIAGMSKGAQREWSAWLYHARNAVDQLDRLVSALSERERPAHVLFFGDHLPGLHQVFSDLRFKNDLPPFQQSTPFVLLGHPSIDVGWQPHLAHQVTEWLITALQVDSPEIYRKLALAHELRTEEPSIFESDEVLDPLYLELLYTSPPENPSRPQ